MTTTIIIIAVVVLLVLYLISLYNGFVKLRNNRENAFANIDVQLKQRHDLIPQLVASVKGYAEHEKTLLEELTRARTAAMGATTIDEKIKAEGQLSAALNAIDEAQNNDGLVVEARALYVDVLNNYADGAYDRDTAEKKLNEVTLMTTRLKEMNLGIGGILAGDCKVEFFTTDGRRLEKAQKGIVVMKITHADGTVTIRKMTME